MKFFLELSEKLLKLIGGLSIFVLSLGYISLYLFYTNFNINISEYIGVSEIIILSLGNLIEAVLLLAFPFYLLLVAVKKQYRVKATKNRKLNRKFALIILGWSIITLTIAFGYGFLLSHINVGKGWTIVLKYIGKEINLIWFALLYGLMFYNDRKVTFEPKDNPKFYITTIIAFTYLMFYQIQSENKILFDDITTKSADKTIIIKMKNDQADLNLKDTMRYIGRTSSYLFVYNRNLKASLVIPASEVSQIIYFDK